MDRMQAQRAIEEIRRQAQETSLLALLEVQAREEQPHLGNQQFLQETIRTIGQKEKIRAITIQRGRIALEEAMTLLQAVVLLLAAVLDVSASMKILDLLMII